jgi:glycosyltransferase involved in cell wall biosynthesis
MATAVQNGITGFVDTRLDRLIEAMQHLLDDPSEARRLGDNARRYALERFALDRFVREWNETFQTVAGPVTRLPERNSHVAAHSTY